MKIVAIFAAAAAQTPLMHRWTPACQGEALAAVQQALRDDSSPCGLHALFCHPTSTCPFDSKSVAKPDGCNRTLLVTGCAASGTHFAASVLKKFTEGTGLQVDHEFAGGASPHISVAWTHRCGRGTQVAAALSAVHNATNMAWGQRQALRPFECSYTHVVHLVRHPLQFIASSLVFAKCIETWVLREQLSFTPMGLCAKAAHEAILANRNDAVAHLIQKSKELRRRYAAHGSRSYLALVEGFMLYWLLDNHATERVAFTRVVIENGVDGLRRLCRAVKPLLQDELSRKGVRGVKRREVACDAVFADPKHVTHGGSETNVTWSDLSQASPGLAAEVWAMAHRYGYAAQADHPFVHTL